ncbi:NUDIX hydrolase [Pseudomonas turukhanskensis]|uniref:NUDIX domain-containing protein n=1 Tax=Pseudomonas turukhanskensis TaxID=1806536 RepID=A0A9W6KC53_9PSED|nr:NUDIX domain-containing protein [Pseudomonas turukhanskensis]GLK91309.1 NUDIX domain-containing protein [Pseudomonas turukhanskensis]
MTVLAIAAACLIDAQGRLLLVRKRGTQAFMLPGGKREPGETALAALLRELLEELNLALPSEAFTVLGQFHAPAANEPDTWIDADIFIAPLNQSVAAAAELEELAWLDLHAPERDDLAPLLRLHVLPRLLAQHVNAVPAG